MKFLNKIKDGIKMINNKTVTTMMSLGSTLKNKENRAIIGIIFVGLGGSLIVSAYIRLPQQY